MNNRKSKESEDMKQREYIKQQQQLRAMAKPTAPNKMITADTMIEDLLSKKETFQKRKDSTAVKHTTVPPWLLPDNSSVHPLYNRIWQAVKIRSGQLVDTPTVSSLLMTSGLSTDTLGFIWNLANKTVPGALTQSELYVVLALVALAQSGYIFNNPAVLSQVPQPPVPKLDLAILPQFSSNFVALSSVPAFPSASMNSESGIHNSYLHAPPSSTPKETAPNSVSLDVNKLQSAPVLTLPNFNLGPAYSQNVGAGMLTGGLGMPVQNMNISTPGQNLSGQNLPMLGGVSAAIPSISLGLSTSVAVTNNQSSPVLNSLPSLNTAVPLVSNVNVNMNSQPVTTVPSNADFNVQTSFLPSNTSFGMESPNTLLSQACSSDLTFKLNELSLTNDSKAPVVPRNAFVDSNNSQNSDDLKTDGFNIDESFDSLSTERASSSVAYNATAASKTNTKPPAPNYNLDLFELKNEVQPVFPDSNIITTAMPADSDSSKEIDENVMFNPIFAEEEIKNEDKSRLNFNFQVGSRVSVGAVNDDNSFDDEFADFQSADFMSVNSSAPNSKSVPNDIQLEDPIKNGDGHPALEDDFSNFQEASVCSNNEEDLFPKPIQSRPTSLNDINLKIDEAYAGWNFSSETSSINWTSSDINENESHSIDDDRVLATSSDVPTGVSSEPGKLEEIDNAFVQDKYSALRMLEPTGEDTVPSDDFGEFLGAEPEQLQFPDPNSPDSDNSIQIRCLEACLEILQTSYTIFSSASSPEVITEVMSDPRGSNHLTCLIEVFRVSERLTQHIENCDVVNEIQAVWKDILPFIDDCKSVQLEDTTGPVCGLCKCDYGPSPVKYGLSIFHAPCANLYLHYVNSTLPNTAAY